MQKVRLRCLNLMDQIRERVIMKDIVIIGAGGFGREVAWLIEDINNEKKEWNLIGFIDDNQKIRGKNLNGYEVIGGLDFLKVTKDVYYVCAIGNSRTRKKIIEENCKGIKAGILIHPSVIKSEFIDIKEGTIICAASILTANISIGRHVIINLDTTIGHDDIIEDFVTIYPSCNISGNVNVKKCSEIGTGTQIIQGIKVGENSIVGAGSVVIRDIQNNKVAVGIPAKEIKDIN